MTKRQKEQRNVLSDKRKKYNLSDAISLLQKCPKANFDESIDVSLVLGVDPKKSDQQVRGLVSLPHGTGKKVRVLVFAKGDKVQEAKSAGADYVGSDDLLEKIKGGWTDFDAVITTPDMMREVGKLGKILGPRGLMPTPKAGTVTNQVGKVTQEIKAGQIAFKVDKQGVLNNSVGKVSFPLDHLEENIRSYLRNVSKAKPQTAKGVYFKSLSLSSTMGPGLFIDMNTEINSLPLS
ncbi:MAG: 50S ribosomal protein L1 [Chlamydiota bacterium]